MLGFSKGKMETNQIDWELYAVTRFLGRNRLLFEHHQEVLRDFLHFFSHLSTELHIFDVGCSSGFFLVILRELGFEKIEGTDISETFVSHARTKGLQCRTANVLNGFIPEEISIAAEPEIAKAMDKVREPLKILAQKIEKSGKSKEEIVKLSFDNFDELFQEKEKFEEIERLKTLVGDKELEKAQKEAKEAYGEKEEEK